MKRSLMWLVGLALINLGTAQADDTLRCNSALVSVNDSMNAVLRKCGEPAGKGPVSYIKVPGPGGRQTTMPAEQWTYGPTYGMYHYLRFEGDRLVSITSERG